MGNVWRSNIMKHCLVTKHADIEVSGQTAKICWIKHRSNCKHTPLSKRGTQERTKHVCHGCPKEQNIAHQNENKKHVFKNCSMAFKFYQTRPNTIKQHQTVLIAITFDHNNQFVIVWWSANTTSGFTCDICNTNADNAAETSKS